MSAELFLARHWQKSPLFMPGAIDMLVPSLPPGELAWLATQDDVESMLIFTEHGPEQTRYRVESGPFDDDLLSGLPQKNWTLLVQDVEKHLPDFARLLALAAFIPDWRIDNLMISFAAPGGSAGPHKDNYDVFLCQGSGHREWRLAALQDSSVSQPESGNCEQLSLLPPFTDPAPLRTKNGDVLYLPPRIPHWGIASDACMTYSVGMRAPALGELRLCFAREFPDDENPFPRRADESQVFYTDPGLMLTESVPGQLSAPAVDRCRELVARSVAVTERALAITLGCVATDLKAWLVPEAPSADEIAAVLREEAPEQALPVHGMSRIAWWTGDRELIVFANGRYLPIPFHYMNFIKRLCARRQLEQKPAQTLTGNELLEWLLNVGAFDVFASSEESSSAAQPDSLLQ
jgi:50S ribosomal protein L16 3-hydroxylase